MGEKLLLASLATAWLVAVMVAFFWLGLWIAATYGEASILYWCFAWVLFGVLASAPFVVYSEVDR